MKFRDKSSAIALLQKKQKMTGNNPKLHLARVNIIAYIKIGEILSFFLKILSGNELLTSMKGHT